jgi:hypothetical protein
LPDGYSPEDLRAYPEILRQLGADLERLRISSALYQKQIADKRTGATPEDIQNKYQPEDFVLFDQYADKVATPNKLFPRYTGPYRVIKQEKNDVTGRHCAMGNERVMHVERLKPFFGTPEEARQMAMLDADQFEIKRFVAYRGDPETRSTMEFLVEFMDEDKIWLPFSQDLFKTHQYEFFCSNNPPLFPLIYSASDAKERIKDMKKARITQVKPGDCVFVDIRSYGSTWYNSLQLPDQDLVRYVVNYKYTRWSRKDQTRISAKCAVFQEDWPKLDAYFVFTYGSQGNFERDWVLVDEYFVQKYPQVLPDSSKRRILDDLAQRT